jgi:hypothetical protein
MRVREDPRFVGRDVGDDRRDIVQREGEALQLRGVEAAEDAHDEVVTQHLDVGQDLATAVADPDQDDPAVVRTPDTLDEAVLLHPIDQPGGVRIRHAQELGDTAHRKLAVAVQHRHHVEVSHRHAMPDEPLAAHAAQLAQRRAKLGDDAVDEGGAVSRGSISSGHKNYSIDTDDLVNAEDFVTGRKGCASR